MCACLARKAVARRFTGLCLDMTTEAHESQPQERLRELNLPLWFKKLHGDSVWSRGYRSTSDSQQPGTTTWLMFGGQEGRGDALQDSHCVRTCACMRAHTILSASRTHQGEREHFHLKAPQARLEPCTHSHKRVRPHKRVRHSDQQHCLLVAKRLR